MTRNTTIYTKVEVLNHTALVDLETDISHTDNQSITYAHVMQPPKTLSRLPCLAVFHNTRQYCPSLESKAVQDWGSVQYSLCLRSPILLPVFLPLLTLICILSL